MRKVYVFVLYAGVLLVLAACGNTKAKEMDELKDFFDENNELSHEVNDYFKGYFRLAEEGNSVEAKASLKNHLRSAEELLEAYEELDFTYETLMEYVTYLKESLEYRIEAESLVLENFNYMEEQLKEEGSVRYDLANSTNRIV